MLLFFDAQSSAVKSGERMMQYGQSIDGGENIGGQIPRLLGQ